MNSEALTLFSAHHWELSVSYLTVWLQARACPHRDLLNLNVTSRGTLDIFTP